MLILLLKLFLFLLLFSWRLLLLLGSPLDEKEAQKRQQKAQMNTEFGDTFPSSWIAGVPE
jgi:hypothetical protein